MVAGLAWGLVFPINKSLWTSSYVLFTAGAAAIVLAGLHRALDGGRASRRAVAVSEPLVALGRNALLLFVLSGLVGRLLILVQAGDGAGGRVLAAAGDLPHRLRPAGGAAQWRRCCTP